MKITDKAMDVNHIVDASVTAVSTFAIDKKKHLNTSHKTQFDTT